MGFKKADRRLSKWIPFFKKLCFSNCLKEKGDDVFRAVLGLFLDFGDPEFDPPKLAFDVLLVNSLPFLVCGVEAGAIISPFSFISYPEFEGIFPFFLFPAGRPAEPSHSHDLFS